MPTFFLNKQVYDYYEWIVTGELVAVEREEAKRVGQLYKKFKSADKIDDKETVKGFLFVIDDENQSLKINFEQELCLKIKELIKADIK